MKTWITLSVLLGLGGGAFAGEGWLTNLEKAKEIAKKEKKMILVDFTGSDWCPPCIALKKNVFDKEAFKKYAKENLVLVELDFPKRQNKKNVSKEQATYNRKQMQKFGVRGFPSVFLLDANGKQLMKKVGFGRGTTCSSYIKALKDAKFQ